MRFLADENLDTEWRRALEDDGHDVLRVADSASIAISAPDPAVLTAATADDRTLLTADQSAFADPPRDDHAGIVVLTSMARSDGEIQRGVRRIEETYPDLDRNVAFLGDWLQLLR